MEEEEKQPGKIIISPEVLVTIARFTALATPGVVRLGGDWAGEMGRLIRHKIGDDGVEITLEDQTVTVDLYVVTRHGVNLLDMGRELQANVTRAIEEIVGLEVLRVDVHIQDVEASAESV